MAPRQRTAIVWFRNDLRLADNPALKRALDTALPIIPVFIWSPAEEEPWVPGAASRVWLHHSLSALDTSLREAGSRLIIRDGNAATCLAELAKTVHAEAVLCTRRYEPWAHVQEEAVEEALKEQCVALRISSGSLLFDPGAIKTGSGGPYRKFTPYWRNCIRNVDISEAIAAPKALPAPRRWPKSEPPDSLELNADAKWAHKIMAHWQAGENGASEMLERFATDHLVDYDTSRDCPAVGSTSRLSPYLHFGEISPRQVWHAVQAQVAESDSAQTEQSAERFLSELGWREFSYYVLHHFSHTPDAPLDERFAQFPWGDSEDALEAWQAGRTGYPLVDAGMRELWARGWMHNRVRMIVASFLTKDLLKSWRDGAAWFWDTLVDADLANNTMGWQWTSGCGADAAPYFRIFNPVLQGQKFDPEGEYVRQWVPELAELPKRWIHSPWDAPKDVLSEAGVVLEETYPAPLIDHKEARDRALAAFHILPKR